ncbi:ephrin-B1-like isoform X2 [Liolophura sinensis]|uniref:ephrin-B1-like isoform X2 n=1 Tax=Liolophura sinensis TaxID=3198878 RepID=UPI0031582FDA
MCLCSTLHRFLVRMPWLLHYLFLLLPLAMSMVAVVDSGGKRLPAVHWNSSNPMFLISNNDHVIDVNNNDMLEIVCPKYNENTPEYLREYYIVYMVKKSEYEACTIYNRTEARLIVNCSEPTQNRIFTLYIQSFGGIPSMPDFESGHTYYFISTSTGRKAGLANQVEGACTHQGMKMMLRVCCDSTKTTKTIRVTSHPDVNPNVPSVRTTPRTTRRTTPRPTTTTRPPPPPPTTTTKKPTEPDYKTRDDEFKRQKLENKVNSDTISDMAGENSAMINSKTSSSQINRALLTFLVLFCLFR